MVSNVKYSNVKCQMSNVKCSIPQEKKIIWNTYFDKDNVYNCFILLCWNITRSIPKKIKSKRVDPFLFINCNKDFKRRSFCYSLYINLSLYMNLMKPSPKRICMLLMKPKKEKVGKEHTYVHMYIHLKPGGFVCCRGCRRKDWINPFSSTFSSSITFW